MSFNPDMTLEEFIKLTEQFADERYGTSITAENSANLVYTADNILAEAETRKERMEKLKMISDTSAWDLTDAPMALIKQKVQTTGNITAGRFSIKIRINKTEKDKTTVNVNIYENKPYKGQFGTNLILKKVDVLKDMRFDTRPWLTYFKNPVKGGYNIPIETAATIVRWCQAVHKMGAFL